MCKHILEEAAWCRKQIYEMDMEIQMDVRKALELAQQLEDEGVVSTTSLAIRSLAKAYTEAKTELDYIEYSKTKHIPAILKG